MRAKPLLFAVLGLAMLGACARGGDVTLSVGMAEGGRPRSDLDAARRVVLTTADLPGYEIASGAEADGASTEAAAAFEDCAGAGAAALGEDRHTARSPGFHKGVSVSVSSLATLAADEAQSRAAMADLTRPDLDGCISRLLQVVFERDLRVAVTSATSEIVSDGATPPDGGQIVTWRTTLEFTSDGRHHVAFSDLTFLRSGRILASLFTFQPDTPYPEAERKRLVATMASRMPV